MKEQLYIPKEIRVGFQKREDTFTKKLAYVIYVDDKGVLRKEASWNSWCDAKIEKLSFSNEPTSGFMLNKNVQRYNWGHFSSNRSYIRVHDPRGFEFEISPENLLGILMDGNCNRRVLEGSFVYSWAGTELVLLPCDTEGYKNSKKFTELQGKKVSATELVPGRTYRTKKEADLIYLGKFAWHQRSFGRAANGQTPTPATRPSKKKFVFVNAENVKNGKLEKPQYYWERPFELLSNLDSLAVCSSETPVEFYAHLMDEFNKSPHSSKFVEVVWSPIKKKEDWPNIKGEAGGDVGVIKVSDEEYESYWLSNNYSMPTYNTTLRNTGDDEKIQCYVYSYTLDPKTNLFNPIMDREMSHSYYREINRHRSRVITTTKADLMNKGISLLKYRLENGKITNPVQIATDSLLDLSDENY